MEIVVIGWAEAWAFVPPANTAVRPAATTTMTAMMIATRERRTDTGYSHDRPGPDQGPASSAPR